MDSTNEVWFRTMLAEGASLTHLLPFLFLLMALLGLRARVRPRVSLWVAAPPQTVFDILDFHEGEEQRWQRTRVTSTLLDPATRHYRLRFTTPLATGASHSNEAEFRVTERQWPSLLVIDRMGLEGQPLRNQLLQMRAEFTPEDGGTRMKLAYLWGPRPLLAQLLSRTDLWGSAYRIKGLAETGKPDYRTDHLISAGVALLTGLLTVATFTSTFGIIASLLLVAMLLFHEFGHLLAFRMIGQPWGRILFLPFLGAVAVPRIGFSTQAQSVFSALMGPGLSILLPIAAAVYLLVGAPHSDLVILTGIVAAILNLFNLLPVEPLDGGVILRSILMRLIGQHVRFGLMSVGAAVVALGHLTHLTVLTAFGTLAVVANIRPRTIDAGLRPLSRLEVAIAIFGFVAVGAAYITLLRYLIANLTMPV